MIITLALRILQLLFGAIVLALSVVLINNHGSGHAPSQLDYGAFCGAFGIIIAVIGIAAIFIEFLQGIIIAALDALTTFLVLAAGIAFAVGAKTGSCTDDDYIISKKIFSVGVKASNKSLGDILNDLTGRCRMVQADTAFLWFLFACFLGTTILCFMGRSKGQTSFI